MKKVILLTALVLACTTGCMANELSECSLSELISTPVKKTTKKATKKTTKKSTSKKTNSTKSSTKTSTAATSATSTSATTNTGTTTPTKATSTSAGSAIAGILGGLLGGGTFGSTGSTAGTIINGILNNVIGSGSFNKESLCAHTWKYSKPGCAFTSENLLAKAGGEIAANKIEEQLEGYYKKAGFSGSNTYFKFNTDGSFESKIDGKSWRGTYTFDEKTHAITMKGLLLSVSGYATQTTNGVSLLFESKKLLTLVQTLTALSGNSTLGTIGNITKNYDGVRVGFEMSK